jgi:hypothetical protein
MPSCRENLPSHPFPQLRHRSSRNCAWAGLAETGRAPGSYRRSREWPAESDTKFPELRDDPGVEMNRRQSRAAVMAAITAATLAVAACTGTATGSASSSGAVSAATGLAAVTPAGTKPVSSVVWATNRDVISLDPIFSAGYPE